MLIITNTAGARNFEIVYEKFNLESVLVEVVHENGSHNCIIINLWFLLASIYSMKHLKESKHQNILLYAENYKHVSGVKLWD